MKIKIDKTFWIEFLIVLLVINYMVVTIILGDQIIYKYIRDVVLIGLFMSQVCKDRLSSTNRVAGLCVILFLFFLLVGFYKAVSPTLGLTVLRKYIFPLLLLFIVSNSKIVNNINRFLKFIVILFSILAAIGIFQAQILGDVFLKNLGYPIEYSYTYGRMMLYNSFYFGGFGIQRVVATLSNSNVCALILGVTLLFIIICYPFLMGIKYKYILLCIIGCAYVLTFSRSNFVAMMIVVILIAWPYIPYKKKLILGVCALAVGVIVLGILQGESGLIYRLFLWIQNTLNFTESSAAGRSIRWLTALNAVLQNPTGIGFGHVGSIASEAGVVTDYYSCENSYLALALDTGWLGFLLYYGFLISMAIKLKRHTRRYKIKGNKLAERLCTAAFVIIIYFCVVMFFSNHIYDMEAVSIIYIFVGLALSITKKNWQIADRIEI